jgi:hypothetical protein
LFALLTGDGKVTTQWLMDKGVRPRRPVPIRNLSKVGVCTNVFDVPCVSEATGNVLKSKASKTPKKSLKMPSGMPQEGSPTGCAGPGHTSPPKTASQTSAPHSEAKVLQKQLLERLPTMHLFTLNLLAWE